ncbi:hypothetical protein MMC17_010084 [Xylographa soralifera]|nr:hypothetical protein [Xylographa soralifera]
MSDSTSSGSSPPLSVIVIGAGWYGLAAAKTYLQFDPSVSLTVVDADSSVGGVWGSSRIYPGLIADSPAGLFEFSDMRMSQELGVDEWADITGQTVQQYLELYARKFGVLKRCMFNTQAVKVERDGAGWNVHVKSSGASVKQEVLHCDKLIVATGVTSKPCLPNLNTSKFLGKVLHSKDLGRWHHFLTSPAVKNVTVVGGNKSAVETVTLCAMAGKTVTWLMRKEGKGPGILFTTRRNGKHRAADGASRWSSVFRPGIYATRSRLHLFLYSGKYSLGTWLREKFWKFLTKSTIRDKRSTQKNRKLLNPETEEYVITQSFLFCAGGGCSNRLIKLTIGNYSFFWPTSGVSFLHDTEEELMKLVDDGSLIHIFRESIVSMSENSIYISDGQVIEADAVVFATGWSSTHSALFDQKTAAELGLPIPLVEENPAEASHWRELQKAAEKTVLDLYPVLRDPPRQPPPRKTSPYRLFRTMVSPKLAAAHDYSLAFVGLVSNNQVSTHAEISALWTVAYLTDKLTDAPVGALLDDAEKMNVDVAAMTTFMEKRYLGRKDIPDVAMEIQDYVDLMMRDMGLRADRKRMKAPPSWFGYQAWKAEWFTPYMPRDYSGVVVEFLKRCKTLSGSKTG